MHMQYLNVNLVACQVWSKVKLLHTLYDGYLNYVRQALYALPRHVVFYNAMQGTTQAHLLVKLWKSRTLSSFRNLQNVASSSGLVKIFVNWSSVLTPSNDISFFATWSLRKWWWISMCLVRECWTGLFTSFTALSLSHKRCTFSKLHHSLAKFVSCKIFVHNKHPRQCIPLWRWTKPHYFVSWRTKTQVIYQANGTLRMCFFYPLCNRHNPNRNSPLIQI